MKITKAVIPSAGQGTRLLPITKAVPKELLLLLDKPLLQWSIEECLNSGIYEIVIVISPQKKSISSYFAEPKSLFANFPNSQDIKIEFVMQEQSLGLGHAIGCAQAIIPKFEPFAVVLPDVILNDNGRSLKSMLDNFDDKQESIIALNNVAANNAHNYGVVKMDSQSRITDLVEKPKNFSGQIAQAVLGRYIFTSSIFLYISATKRDEKNEVQITDAMRLQLAEENIYGYEVNEQHFDCGNFAGLLAANLELGLSNPKFEVAIHKIIKKYR